MAETQGGGSGHFGTCLHKFRQNRSNTVTFVTVSHQGYKVAETQGGGSGCVGTFLPKFLQNRSHTVTFVKVAPQGYKVVETLKRKRARVFMQVRTFFSSGVHTYPIRS